MSSKVCGVVPGPYEMTLLPDTTGSVYRRAQSERNLLESMRHVHDWPSVLMIGGHIVGFSLDR